MPRTRQTWFNHTRESARVQRSVADGLVYGDSAVGQIFGERVEGVFYSNFTKSDPAFGDHPDSLFDGPSDGDKWDVFNGADQHHVGDVLAPASVDFPNVGNILRVQPNTNQNLLRLIRNGLPITGDEGEHLYFRCMSRYNGPHTSDPSNHPIEAGNAGTIPWAFRYRTLSSTTFQHEWTSGAWGGHYFHSPVFTIGADVPRYYELHIEFLESGLCNFEAKIRDADGVQTHDSSDYSHTNGTNNMANYPAGTLAMGGYSNLATVQIGLNGIGGTDWHPSFIYGYQAAVALSLIDWCGIHGTIYTAADPTGEVVGAGG